MTNLETSNISLSSGSLQMILDGEDIDSAILQVIGYKKIPGEGNERFRLLLNDGFRTFSFFILATQLNHLIVNKELEKYSIIKLNRYTCTEPLPNKKIILCLDVTPLIPGCRINAQIDCKRNMPSCTLVLTPNSSTQIPVTPDSSTQIPVMDKIMDVNKGSSFYSRDNSRNLPQCDIQSLKPSSSVTVTPKQIYPSTSKCDPICAVNKNANNIGIKPNSVAHNSFTTLTSKHIFSSPKLDSCFKPTFSGPRLENSNKYESQTDNSCSLININETINQTQRKNYFIPISSLNPYQSKWTVKARVIYKSHIIDYANTKKSGKLFTFYLLDSSGEIRATAFDDLAEQAYHFIELNKVYYVSNATVKLPKSDAPTKYNFELCITLSTKIEEFHGDNGDIPFFDFKFVPLNQVEQAMNGFVDVIGVCIDYSELKNIKVKGNSREVQKLDFTIADMQNTLMGVSLWGTDAENFKPQNNPVVAIKNAKVTSFNRCSLSVSSSSMIFINPAIKETGLLKSWFKKNCKDVQLNSSLSERNQPWKKLSDITIDAFISMDMSDYFTVKATVIMVQKDNSLYQSCPLSDCFKKVSVTPDNLYHCNFSADLWVVAFRETAELIIQYKTEELCDFKERDFDKYMDILSNLHFKTFIFKLRSRIENFAGTSQLKTAILDVKPVESLFYTKKLLCDINRFNNILNQME